MYSFASMLMLYGESAGCIANSRHTCFLGKFAGSRKIFGRSSAADLSPSHSLCSDRVSGDNTCLIYVRQLLRLSHSQLWRLRLQRVRRLSPSTSPSPLRRWSQLCLCSTTTGLGQGRAGLQSCCAMLIGRFRTRMAKF